MGKVSIARENLRKFEEKRMVGCLQEAVEPMEVYLFFSSAHACNRGGETGVPKCQQRQEGKNVLFLLPASQRRQQEKKQGNPTANAGSRGKGGNILFLLPTQAAGR